MKESIGVTQIFMIVIVLILLFAGVISITINHTNSYAVKDNIITIIENANGFDMTAELNNTNNEDEPLKMIVDSLSGISYRQTGKCPYPEYNGTETSEEKEKYVVQGYSRNGTKTLGNDKSSFCIIRIDGGQEAGHKKYYYQVVVFYSLDIPVLRQVLNFKVMGQTKTLFN